MKNSTTNIVEEVRKKFIDNFPEGLLLTEAGASKFEEEGLYFRIHLNYHSIVKHIKGGRKDDKSDILFYLASHQLPAYLVDEYYKYYRSFPQSEVGNFYEYWQERWIILKNIIQKAQEIINSEHISDTDKIVVNVGFRTYDHKDKDSYHPKLYDVIRVYNNGKEYEFNKTADCKGIDATFADIFILSDKNFIKLSIGENGVIDRTENIIQRDIKQINIADNETLEIYFHGYYDPEIIVLDDYNTALQLQRDLTNLRQQRTNKEKLEQHKE